MNQVDVEAAAQSAVRRTQNDMNLFDLLPRHQQGAGLITGLFREAAQHFRKLGRVRAEVFHIRLGTAQSRGGHHIHGFGNLSGFLNRNNFILNIF